MHNYDKHCMHATGVAGLHSEQPECTIFVNQEIEQRAEQLQATPHEIISIMNPRSFQQSYRPIIEACGLITCSLQSALNSQVHSIQSCIGN